MVYDFDAIEFLINKKIAIKITKILIKMNYINGIQRAKIIDDNIQFLKNTNSNLFPYSVMVDNYSYYIIDFENYYESEKMKNQLKKENKINKVETLILTYETKQSKKENYQSVYIKELENELREYELTNDITYFDAFLNDLLIKNESAQVKNSGYPKYLYKYKQLYQIDPCWYNDSLIQKYVLNPFSLKSIDESEVYFSSPFELNDPFECNVGSRLAPTQYNQFKIFSTSKIYNDISMWSYYGDSNYGICLKYNFFDIYNASSSYFSKIYIGNVCYSPIRITDSYLKFLKIFFSKKIAEEKFFLRLIFTKSSNWKHEKEYRFVGLDDLNEYGCSIKNIPICDAYLGCKFNEYNLLSSINNPVIKQCRKLIIDNRKYKLC